MFTIIRYVSGLSDYILDDDGDIKTFDSEEEALEYIDYDSLEDAEFDGYYIQEE